MSGTRLPLGQKLTYSSADIAGALSYITLNTWLLYFLVNIAGLPPVQAGAVFLLGRLVDALLDPVIGAYSDRVKPTRGRLVFLAPWRGPGGRQLRAALFTSP